MCISCSDCTHFMRDSRTVFWLEYGRRWPGNPYSTVVLPVYGRTGPRTRPRIVRHRGDGFQRPTRAPAPAPTTHLLTNLMSNLGPCSESLWRPYAAIPHVKPVPSFKAHEKRGGYLDPRFRLATPRGVCLEKSGDLFRIGRATFVVRNLNRLTELTDSIDSPDPDTVR